MLWGRVRSWYGVSVCWGRYGWRTWLELVLTRWKKSSSAVLNNDRHVASAVVHCDVATNQDVRGRQMNTCQTTMVSRTGCARWLLRGICLAATWSACCASTALASRTACWIRMTAAQSRDRLPSTCRSVWRRGLANSTRAQCPAAVAAAPPSASLRRRSPSSCLGLALSCCLPPTLADVQSLSGTCPLLRPAQPNRCHPQT